MAAPVRIQIQIDKLIQRERGRAHRSIIGWRSGRVPSHDRGYGVQMRSLFVWLFEVCIFHFSTGTSDAIIKAPVQPRSTEKP